MQSPELISPGLTHMLHVCAATGTCAACGDDHTENWIVREDWMDRFTPETLCKACVAALNQYRQVV